LTKKIVKSEKKFLPLFRNTKIVGMKHFLLPIITSFALTAQGQLVIDNATFFIGENAVVTVQGDLTTNVAIQAGGSGATRGRIQMKGSSAQTITINSATASIPRLEIDNTNHVQLAGSNDLRIENQLDFTNGKLQLGSRNILLPEGITITGAGAGKFIETNGTGEARQLMTANGTRVVPIGTGTHYNPTTITTTGSTFGSNAYIGVRSTGSPVSTPQRHPRTETFLNTAWAVTRSGVTGGTVNVVGTYTDGQLAGLGTPVEADLNGFFWDGTSWSMAGGTQNPANNTVGADVGASGGVVYGMNKFVLANAKVFLHGAFNNATGLMNDGLRAAGSIPLNDPYRVAPYNYPHSANNNAIAETIAPSVLSAQVNPENNIVDWVVVELLNNNSPAAVIQSRSALVRRNGTLVDVDGTSPIYFKNLNPGNYNISVRHRNHLGAMTNATQALSLNSGSSYDFSLNATSAFVNPSFTYGPLRELPRTGNTSVWGLYSSDGNFNKRVQITGSPSVNDYSLLLNSINLTPGYYQRDYNMDGTVRTTGSPNLNDYSKMLNSLNTLNAVQQHEKL
jgi:hypothetical protein